MLQLLFGTECRKIMNQNHQKFHFFPNQRSRIVYLCLGSLLPSSLLSVAAVSSPLPAKQIISSPLARVVQTAGTKPTQTPIPNRIAQGSELSDINGNWAEPFIRTLVANGIIKGYPDGTFKPDRLVTRAEFAALVSKAFSLSPIRTAKTFNDVPPNDWATAVIQKAYQGGFLAGYANDRFAPKQNILRIESLVSLINGSKLEPTAKLELDGVFGDAAQIPSYGQNAIVAATQKCVAIGVDYDNSKLPGGNFNPNQAATRADVAALIHQVLVSTGKLTPLDKNNPANKYIASCPGGTYATIVANDSTPPPVVAPAPIPAPAPVVAAPIANDSNPVSNYSAPVSGLNSPSAFGANWGEVFTGVGYQNTTRPQIFSVANARGQGGQDGAIAIGFGLGNSRTLAGLEVIATSNSTVRRGFFNEGAVSLKLHKQFSSNFALAAGSDNAISYGVGSDVGQSYYGVASFVLNPSANLNLFSNTTVSLGIGDGRYRSVGDVREDRSTLGVFGSIGTRISPNISLIADWDGQDLGIGVPIGIPLGSNFSIGITPAVVDLINPETGGRRFVFSGGVGYNF
jgi:S-layer homology domain